MTDLKPIIFIEQDFQEAIETLRAVALWPTPDDPPALRRAFGRNLFHTDAIHAIRAVRKALRLLGQDDSNELSKISE